MARGRAQQEEPQVEEASEELVRLQFNEELTWRPGKPIAMTELLSRLERLSKELTDMDQDTADKDSLIKVADALGQRNLIAHKDAGVKAKVACCLVEILRICAPNAPFTEDQLKVRVSAVNSGWPG
jgi:sister chromatid cohesion protein PDS5